MKIKELFENEVKNITITNKNIVNGKLKKQYPNITGDFISSCPELTSLEGCPDEVGGNFNCFGTKITSLKGAPSTVGRVFSCTSTNITSLEGAPKKVGADFYCTDTKITSLEGIGKDYLQEIKGGLYLNSCKQLTSHMLGILKIKNLKKIEFDVNKHVETIFNKHLSSNRDMTECQMDLIEAGFKEYAKL
jgi:hypothetical protein